jgi:hypothetical protein
MCETSEILNGMKQQAFTGRGSNQTTEPLLKRSGQQPEAVLARGAGKPHYRFSKRDKVPLTRILPAN